MLPAGTADPTDVVSPRIGAYLIDGLVSLVFVGVAFLVVQPTFWQTQQVSSAATARATCWDFDEAAGRDPSADGQLVRPTADAVGFGDHDPDRELCTSVGDTILWFDPLAAFGQYVAIAALSGVLNQLNLIVLQSITGASVGKLIVGMRVVRADGTKARFWQILVRQLLMLVDTLIFSLVGLISMLTSRGHQRVGDMVAKTYVVRRSSMGAPLEIPEKAPRAPATWAPPGAGGPPPHPDGPHWDPHRQTWIRYDRGAEHWTMWDEWRRDWREIDT